MSKTLATILVVCTLVAGGEAHACKMHMDEDCWIRKSYETTGNMDKYYEYQASKDRTARTLDRIENERQIEDIRQKYRNDSKPSTCYTDSNGNIKCF